MSGILDRRAEERYSFVAPILISWEDSNDCQHDELGTTVNVSLYGALVEVPEPIPLGTNVRLRIQENDISSKAMVRHCSEIYGWFRIGLQFERILLAERIPSLDAVLIKSHRNASTTPLAAPKHSSPWRELLHRVARAMAA